jgi:hypothetical protein
MIRYHEPLQSDHRPDEVIRCGVQATDDAAVLAQRMPPESLGTRLGVLESRHHQEELL